MIPLHFGLWHGGCKLSYLRYLTFKTLRYFHPNSKISLFIGDKFNNKNHNWNIEKQDFERPEDIKKDYLEKLKELDVEIKHVDWFSQYASNYQSDFFRYFYLHNFSGFYLDTDQIILKSFESLPLENDLIYSGFPASSCGYYIPVGVLGASKESEIVKAMMNELPKLINTNNYNSIGPFGFRKVLESRKWNDRMFNAPSNYFYPVSESHKVNEIYNGTLKLTDESFALHLFLGHPVSQEFNKIYTEEMAKVNNDTISIFLRKKRLV